MLGEGWHCERRSAFNDHLAGQAVHSSLCEKSRHAASDLQMSEDQLAHLYDLLGFYKVSDAALIIDASRIEARSCLLR